MQKQQSLFLKFSEAYQIGNWVMQFPALTLMVYLRRDIGYRFLNPLLLIAVFGLLAVITIIGTPGNEDAQPWLLLVFCGIGFFNGLAQRFRRWREINRGVTHHSYYIGSSPFNFGWLPNFLRRNRRVARYFDPIFCAGLGLILYPYSRALAVWLVFAAFCLKGFEHQVFCRERNRTLDMVDSVLVAETQAQTLERMESEQFAQNIPAQQGISTGLGNDIESSIEQHRKARDSRRG